MKAPGKLPVIPTPVALRVQRVRMTVVPSLVFAGSVAIIALLWQDRVEATMTSGWAANSSSPQAGAVVQVRTPGGHGIVGAAPILQAGSQSETVSLAIQPSFELTGMEMVLPAPVSVPTGLHLHPGKLVDLNSISTTD